MNPARNPLHILVLSLVSISMTLVACPVAKADGILVLRGSSSVDRYGGPGWDNFSAVLDAATNNGVSVTTSIEDKNELFSYGGLLLEYRTKVPFTPPFDTHKMLTEVERTNLIEFIESGRRVVMLGEWSPWQTWDQEILGIVGGSYAGSIESALTTSSVFSHPLTQGVETLTLQYPGLANGGTQLYDRNFAALWGEKLNVLTILDTVYVDQNWSLDNGGAFATNVANWLATPEPSVSALLASVLGFLYGGSFCGRSRRRERPPAG